MAELHQRSEQEVLSRSFLATKNALAEEMSVGDGGGVVTQVQELLNRIFDATNNVLKMEA